MPELLGQHVDIGLAQADDRLVAHHIDIGGGGVQKRGLLRGAQALAPGLHRGLGLADGVDILKALEDGLAERHGIAARMRDAFDVADTAESLLLLWLLLLLCSERGTEGRLKCRGGGIALLNLLNLLLSAPSHNVGLGVLEGGIAGCADIRAQAGFGHGDLLVGGAQICPLGIQHRVDEIGVGQSLDQRFGRDRARAENDPQGNTCDGRRPATPPGAFRAGSTMPAQDACHILGLRGGNGPRPRPRIDHKALQGRR